MKASISDYDDIKVISISGKITIGEGDVKLRQLISETTEAGSKKIILDLKNVKYVDSSGIGELVSSYTTLRNRGGELALCNLNSKIYGLLQLTALVSVFGIYDSLEDAVQALRS